MIWKPSPNFSNQRKKICKVILHWIGTGTAEGAVQWLCNPQSNASAHYLVDNKRIFQLVKEHNTAYHCGDWNTNLESIGIEHNATTSRNASETTYKTSGRLLRDICKRHDIPLDRKHILKHSEVSPTQCPGTLDIDKIIKLAKGGEDMTEAEVRKIVKSMLNLGDEVGENTPADVVRTYERVKSLREDFNKLEEKLEEGGDEVEEIPQSETGFILARCINSILKQLFPARFK